MILTRQQKTFFLYHSQIYNKLLLVLKQLSILNFSKYLPKATTDCKTCSSKRRHSLRTRSIRHRSITTWASSLSKLRPPAAFRWRHRARFRRHQLRKTCSPRLPSISGLPRPWCLRPSTRTTERLSCRFRKMPFPALKLLPAKLLPFKFLLSQFRRN